MIAVALLTAHPGNVRRDLDLSADSWPRSRRTASWSRCGSPPTGRRVTASSTGTAGSPPRSKPGLAEVPADLAGDRAGDEPGQFLDMWVAHRHRNPLAPLEEADALFAAREAGATRARIRKATGLKPPTSPPP